MDTPRRPTRTSRTMRRRPQQHELQQQAVRVPGFPDDLPVSAKRVEIASAIRDHQVVIVCGETGSGKTTQIPKICLAMGRGTGGRGIIGHTQPRRIAARSVAARIADELQTPLGQVAGYKIRFSDTLSRNASVKIMTDGILLAETRRDPQLRAYDTLIIDEAHERSLNIDFLLGYLKRLLPRRRDLKVIITSATINPQTFSEHFGGARTAPIIEVSGRTYPVEVRYRPLVRDDPEEDDRDLRRGVIDAVDEATAHGPGDALVFLSGEREIREMSKALAGHLGDAAEVLPLFARLSAEEQNRIFAPHKQRRIILATNVAETSLTVPGIRYVIDSGKARMSRYSARNGVQRLPIEPISRASADQRKGRCGRIGPGVCIRLYSEDDFTAREQYTPPEILRANLASVILQMKSLRLGRIEDFPFVEPPRWAMITDGYSTLHELGAIDEWGEITPLGDELARLPIDPRLGRMILASREEGSLNDVLIIAAALSIQDPRERPHEKQEAADQAHREFRDENSDFVTLLNIWQAFQTQSRELSQSRLRKWCRDHFLSYVRMREWVDVHHQLRDLIAEAEVTEGSRPSAASRRHRSKVKGRQPKADSRSDSLHRAILAGLLSRIGVKHPETHEYSGAHGRKFHIFPGSGLFKNPPQWVMAAEIVETTKTYAHTVARISPKWLERLTPHLVKKRYEEPHWREKSSDVAAFETVTLFGLEIIKNRRAAYGPIDPKVSRDIFIRSGLVEERFRTNAPWAKHNRKLLSNLRAIESKARRRGVLIDDERIFALYNPIIPEGMYSGALFEAWRRKAEKKNPRVLFLKREDLLANEPDDVTAERYPARLIVNGAPLPLTYRFEPGHEEDGVTLTVPASMIDQVPAQRLEWLVPGMIEEKIGALIRSLPKSIRRDLAPGATAELASTCNEMVRFGEGPLLDALGDVLHRLTGIEVPRDAWSSVDLPAHLLMNIRAVDDAGKTLAKGRDVGEVAAQVRSSTRGDASLGPGLGGALPEGRFTSWDFGEIPQAITMKRGGIDVTAYPAIVDDTDAIVIRAMQTPQQAQHAMRSGLRRLIMLTHNREMKELAHHLPNLDRMALDYAALGRGGKAELAQQLLAALINRAFLDHEQASSVRDRKSFKRIVTDGWHRTDAAISEVCDVIGRTLTTATTLRTMLDELRAPQLAPSSREIKQHLDHLLGKGFIAQTPFNRLMHLPRYLEGDRRRITKITSGKLTRDRGLAAEYEPLWQRYLKREESAARQSMHEPPLDEHRWMLEELRIALFAQELGTAVRVSTKRVEEHWRTLPTHR